jgi:hypothetical protein
MLNQLSSSYSPSWLLFTLKKDGFGWQGLQGIDCVGGLGGGGGRTGDVFQIYKVVTGKAIAIC